MKDHCLARILGLDIAEEDLNFSDMQRSALLIEDNILYKHATVQFNYTTYDVRRDKDVIKAGGCIMMPSYEDADTPDRQPFWYARVIGIYHIKVSHAPSSTSGLRIDFLWVRWLGQDPDWKSGHNACRMEKVGYVPIGGSDESSGPAFGFVNPESVIRASHLIPAFAEGKTYDLLPSSRFLDTEEGDYVNFFINRYV